MSADDDLSADCGILCWSVIMVVVWALVLALMWALTMGA